MVLFAYNILLVRNDAAHSNSRLNISISLIILTYLLAACKAPSPFKCVGRLIVNVLPCPTLLFTSIFPLCFSMMFLAVTSPAPIFTREPLCEKSKSKSFFRRFFDMPCPLSEIWIRMWLSVHSSLLFSSSSSFRLLFSFLFFFSSFFLLTLFRYASLRRVNSRSVSSTS